MKTHGDDLIDAQNEATDPSGTTGRWPRGGIALGLAGGSAKGLAHVGVLRALEEHNLAPSYIAGTSAGAIIGGLYAAGMSVDELDAFLADFDRGGFNKLIDLNWGRGSLVAGDRIEDMLRQLVGNIRIENLQIAFVATAVDIHTGRGFFFDRGDLVDAIRASISIPGIFEPIDANGGHLVDGGVRKNLPLAVLNRYEPRMGYVETVAAVERYKAGLKPLLAASNVESIAGGPPPA